MSYSGTIFKENVFPFTEDPFIALVSSDHPLTQKGFVTPEDPAREPFIFSMTDDPVPPVTSETAKSAVSGYYYY